MNLSLHGKRALVCGATEGIGMAAAIELALLGASLTLVARTEDKLDQMCAEMPRPRVPVEGAGSGPEAAARELPVHRYFKVDLGDVAAVASLAAELGKLTTGDGTTSRAGSGAADTGPIEILVNNTGGPPGGKLIEAKIEQFLSAMNAQLFAAHILTQALVPGMKAAGYGRVINVISTSVKAPIAGLGVSNTVRGAVASWAKTLAGELGPFGITVNNLLPGYTQTGRLTSLLESKSKSLGKSESDVAAEMIAGIPVGRFGKPEELGAAIAFLASPSAGYINGINLPVDGGRLPTL